LVQKGEFLQLVIFLAGEFPFSSAEEVALSPGWHNQEREVIMEAQPAQIAEIYSSERLSTAAAVRAYQCNTF